MIDHETYHVQITLRKIMISRDKDMEYFRKASPSITFRPRFWKNTYRDFILDSRIPYGGFLKKSKNPYRESSILNDLSW